MKTLPRRVWLVAGSHILAGVSSLNIPVGIAVPSGFFNRQTFKWEAGPSGRIIRVLNAIGGLAEFDTGGEGVADNFGLGTEERQLLAARAGHSLWRVPSPHFSAWDASRKRQEVTLHSRHIIPAGPSILASHRSAGGLSRFTTPTIPPARGAEAQQFSQRHQQVLCAKIVDRPVGHDLQRESQSRPARALPLALRRWRSRPRRKCARSRWRRSRHCATLRRPGRRVPTPLAVSGCRSETLPHEFAYCPPARRALCPGLFRAAAGG